MQPVLTPSQPVLTSWVLTDHRYTACSDTMDPDHRQTACSDTLEQLHSWPHSSPDGRRQTYKSTPPPVPPHQIHSPPVPPHQIHPTFPVTRRTTPPQRDSKPRQCQLFNSLPTTMETYFIYLPWTEQAFMADRITQCFFIMQITNVHH